MFRNVLLRRFQQFPTHIHTDDAARGTDQARRSKDGPSVAASQVENRAPFQVRGQRKAQLPCGTSSSSGAISFRAFSMSV